MGSGVVVLREGFEAALVVGIVLAFLDRTGRRDGFTTIWAGVAAAVGISVAAAVGLFTVGAELEGTAGAAFEGAAAIAAAGLLTWMIFWMRRQARSIRKEIEGRVSSALAEGSAIGLAAIAFVGVLREGVETALFLFSTTEASHPAVSFAGGVVGLGIAIALGYAFYRGSSRLNLRVFFQATSVLLLLFAGWLLTNGLEELAEGGVIPENEALLVTAFAAPTAATLYFLFRKPRSQSTA